MPSATTRERERTRERKLTQPLAALSAQGPALPYPTMTPGPAHSVTFPHAARFAASPYIYTPKFDPGRYLSFLVHGSARDFKIQFSRYIVRSPFTQSAPVLLFPLRQIGAHGHNLSPERLQFLVPPPQAFYLLLQVCLLFDPISSLLVPI